MNLRFGDLDDFVSLLSVFEPARPYEEYTGCYDEISNSLSEIK